MRSGGLKVPGYRGVLLCLSRGVATRASITVLAPQLPPVRLRSLAALLGAASDVQQDGLGLLGALEHGRDELDEARVLGLLQAPLQAVLHHSHELAVAQLPVVWKGRRGSDTRYDVRNMWELH